MLIHTLTLLLCLSGLSQAEDCMSSMGSKSKRCLPKAEVKDFSGMMQDGDPCFTYKGNRNCFVTQINLHPCTCTAECGCSGSAPTIEKCEASKLPEIPDCSTDKDTYCPLNNKYVNTMCKYCGVDPKRCVDFCNRGLSEEEKTQLLNKMNELRRKVANGAQEGQDMASNMNKLTWNDDLAIVAQRLADQCPEYHDKNRLIPGQSSVGQNMADAWNPSNFPDKALEKKVLMWYSEVEFWPASSTPKFDNKGNKPNAVVGHFTQLVWAKSSQVGCGYISYKDHAEKVKNYPFRQTLVCNFAPSGNFMTAPVYEIGTPGTKCDAGKTADNGLCV